MGNSCVVCSQALTGEMPELVHATPKERQTFANQFYHLPFAIFRGPILQVYWASPP